MCEKISIQRVVFPTGCRGKKWPNWPTRGSSAITPCPVKRIKSNLKCQWRIGSRIKEPKTFEIGKGVHACEATIFQKVEIFDIFVPHSHALRRVTWNYIQPSDPGASRPCQTWIGAKNRTCGAINLIFCLRVNLIPAVCRFAASCR